MHSTIVPQSPQSVSGERPLVPVPSEAKAAVAVPDLTPAEPVSSETTMLVLFVAPGARSEMVPVPDAAPVAPEKEASSFSLKASFVTVFWTVSAWLTVSPTRELPKVMSLSAAVVAGR